MLVMENINMTHEFKHPKYYTELRKRNREVLRSGRGLAVNQAPHVSDQAISKRQPTGESERASWSGPQASSHKPKGTSCSFDKTQAGPGARRKPQAPSSKVQAPSHKHQAS